MGRMRRTSSTSSNGMKRMRSNSRKQQRMTYNDRWSWEQAGGRMREQAGERWRARTSRRGGGGGGGG
eukprot:3817399-Pyramimonas_sp.AAC.1